MAVNSGLVAFPTGYDPAWSASGIHLWRPQPPKGYLALGCLATSGVEAPSLTAMVCLHHTVGIAAPLGQCFNVKQQESRQDEGDVGHFSEDPGANVWCVDNAAATFTVSSIEEGSHPIGTAFWAGLNSTVTSKHSCATAHSESRPPCCKAFAC